jgi:hypothetical protein
MPDDIKWLIGTASALFLSIGGLVAGVMTRITTRMEKGDDRLHERINRVRDEFVRRDDLDGHMARVDRALTEMRDSQAKIHDMLLEVLTSGTRKPPRARQ